MKIRGPVAVDRNFLESGLFLPQQVLRGVAIGTGELRIDRDRGHGNGILDQLYIVYDDPVTTRAKTRTSTCAAPPRKSARAAALVVSPEVSTSSIRTISRPAIRN